MASVKGRAQHHRSHALRAARAIRKADARHHTKSAADRRLQQMQILGAAVAAMVGLATVAKTINDAYATAIRDTRDQISSAQQFYVRAAERALSIRFSNSAVAPELLNTSFREMVNQGPVEFHPPIGARKMAEQGQTQICAARLFAIAEFYAAADAATQQYFQDAETRAAARAPKAWSNCQDLIARAASQGANQQKSISEEATVAARVEAHLQSVQDKNRAEAAAKANAQAAGQTPAAGAAAAPDAAAAPPHAVNKAAADTAAGWHIESFYCPASGDGAQRTAAAAAAELGRLADSRFRVGGEILGAVTVEPAVRPMTGNAIVYDADEKAFATALQATLAIRGLRYRLQPNDADHTPWRLGLYACAAAPAGTAPAASPTAPAAATVTPPAAAATPTAAGALPVQAKYEVDFPDGAFTLDDAAKDVLTQASVAARQTHVTAISITSYDASGDLGVVKPIQMARRANAVKNALNRRLPAVTVTVAPAVASPSKSGQSATWVEIRLGS